MYKDSKKFSYCRIQNFIIFRAKRAMMTAYKTYYEERARALDQIIEKFKQPTTFEDFVSHVFAPSQPAHIIQVVY